MRPQKLTLSDIQNRFSDLNDSGWKLSEDHSALSKTFRFPTFKDAFAWMTLVADAAEALDHHPDWSNSWNRVTVSLTTHDRKGLTSLDFDLATEMENLATRYLIN